MADRKDMATGKQNKMNVHLADEATAREVRLILSYEAAARGMTLGQACSELVMEAADTDGYPPEVQERLAEIAAESRRRAVERSLRAGRSAGEDADHDE